MKLSEDSKSMMHYQARQISVICSEIVQNVDANGSMTDAVFLEKWREIQARIDAIRIEVFHGTFERKM